MIARGLPVFIASFVLVFTACRENIQLGDAPDAADAGADAASDSASDAAPPTCTAAPVRTLVTTADESVGDLRAIGVAAGMLWVLSALPEGTGLLSRMPVDGGALAGVATLGRDPVALSLSPDGAYAFVAVRGSAQITRVDGSGNGIVADAMGVPAGVVAGDRGSATWTLPAEGRVATWDFAAGGAPTIVANVASATSIARDGSTFYVTGAGALHAFEAGREPPRLVASFCDAGRPGIAGASVFCADHGSIGQIDLANSDVNVIATDQPGAADVVVGGGRAFWRTGSGASILMAAPVDAVSGPNVLAIGQGGALLLANDDCSVFFTENRGIWRRGF